jgi:hypothetical protein
MGRSLVMTEISHEYWKSISQPVHLDPVTMKPIPGKEVKQKKRHQRKCAQCGTKYTNEAMQSKYCSDACYRESLKKTKICQVCKKEFQTSHKTARFCSAACVGKYNSKRNKLTVLP